MMKKKKKRNQRIKKKPSEGEKKTREKRDPSKSSRDKSKRKHRDRSKKRKEKPSALTSIIYPALDKLEDNCDTKEDGQLIAALQQLKTTFDNAEKLQPGISHALIAQIIDTLKKSAQ
jgi:hypothetical protein